MPWTRTHDYPQASVTSRVANSPMKPATNARLLAAHSFMVPQIEMSGSFYYATYVLFDNISGYFYVFVDTTSLTRPRLCSVEGDRWAD